MEIRCRHFSPFSSVGHRICRNLFRLFQFSVQMNNRHDTCVLAAQPPPRWCRPSLPAVGTSSALSHRPLDKQEFLIWAVQLSLCLYTSCQIQWASVRALSLRNFHGPVFRSHSLDQYLFPWAHTERGQGEEWCPRVGFKLQSRQLSVIFKPLQPDSICSSNPCGLKHFDPGLTLFSSMIQAYRFWCGIYTICSPTPVSPH